jgi:hypothetical protein
VEAVDRKIQSVQLSLLIGPASPSPVSREVLDALAEVEVQVQDTEASGFQLTFSIEKRSPLQILFLLTGGVPLLFIRVVLVVTVNGASSVLIDGVVTHNQYSPGDKGSNSTLTLTGKDLTALMDQDERSGFPYPSSKPEDRISQMLARYAVFGIKTHICKPLISIADHNTHRIPGQQGTDLAYIRLLAQQVGYVFYLKPGPNPGDSTAYWGPQNKTGAVQPALSADMDAYTNVESLSFSVDQEQNRKPLVITSSGEDGAAVTISIPAASPLNPPLGKVPPKAANILGDLIPFRDDLAKLPVGRALMMGLAAVARNTEVVTCDGSLDVTRYGGVLMPRQLVAVRGSRQAFDGLYYVQSVTHKIKRGEYKQNFKLTRDGLGSTLQQVTV